MYEIYSVFRIGQINSAIGSMKEFGWDFYHESQYVFYRRRKSKNVAF